MKLMIVVVVTMLISCVETVSYAARLSGARTGKIGASTSLFNILVLFARFAVMSQSILLASMLEAVTRFKDKIPLMNYEELINDLLINFRVVLFGMSMGIVLGMFLLPTVARVLAIGTRKLDKHGSVPKIFRSEGILRLFWKMPSQFWIPSFRNNWQIIKETRIGANFFWMNAVIFSFYSIAILSSLYAGVLVPDHRTVANQMATVINGVGTILLVIFVDPICSKLLDDVVSDARPYRDLKVTVFHLGAGRLVGTVIAQVLLFPFAYLISLIAPHI
ncbi:hypothetical protein AYJ08_16215 [Brevibacillus sp. SKDU10]|uniref:lipid II flippase family protein n=1 Tax=Brevibacillus sp. SKDU10 TaxID=1247872 RepID=UPI0007C8A1A8|nr:DUF2837 family protein [Brevibacillus sp. SKDU10]OAJ72921.1 hypothetical protein AYJ08_16215 [Brevibacillus sp. SKDU10]